MSVTRREVADAPSARPDTGHVSTDRNWAIGHPEKAIDDAYRSKHLVTVTAKGVIARSTARRPSIRTSTPARMGDGKA